MAVTSKDFGVDNVGNQRLKSENQNAFVRLDNENKTNKYTRPHQWIIIKKELGTLSRQYSEIEPHKFCNSLMTGRGVEH